jgi:hypothetical protein
MTDLPLYEDADDAPVPRPRDEMRFESVSASPYADGRRVRLKFRFPPFSDRPNVDAVVTNAQGQTVATMSLIEAMDQEFEFTLHLRGPEPRGEHTVRLSLFYLAGDDQPDLRQVVDEQAVAFTIPSPG